MNPMRLLTRRWAGVALVGGLLAACDPFSVQDPSRYTDAALDSALTSVADGVEGQFQLILDDFVIYQSLLADEWRHTGTWIQYEDADKGRARYANSPGDFIFNTLLRARFSSQDAQARFAKPGVALANTDLKVVQVKSVEAWVDLYLGEGFCEAPAEPGGPAVSDNAMLDQAITKLTAARDAAQQGGLTDFVRWNNAGLARANLLRGNYAAAAAAANLVPDGFSKVAKFSQTNISQNNWVVLTNTVGFNKAAGMREKWWPMVDTIAGLLRDPWSGQLDSRVPISHPPKSLGVDGNTQHYSQFKYKGLGDDLPITDSQEMRLIEAEVAWRNNDLTTAMAKMDALRAAVGLNALPATTDPATVFSYLLHEYFAEQFMEGHRLTHIRRFNLITSLLGAGRLTKYPLSQFEALYNVNIEDDLALRCAPVSS